MRRLGNIAADIRRETLASLKLVHTAPADEGAQQPQAFDPSSLTPMQQAALLFMHESPVKRALYRILTEHETPTRDDYLDLADRGLARKRINERWHILTTEGTCAAFRLEALLCDQFKISRKETLRREARLNRRGWLAPGMSEAGNA